MQLDLFKTKSTSALLGDTLKTCYKCKKEKALHCYSKKLNASGTDIKQAYCKDCQKDHKSVITVIHRSAPPKPKECDCCSKEGHTLILDHDHDTNLFRGWLCYRCNSGIGQLGDDIAGLEKALSYLRKQYGQ
jgi:hypothetical protein